MSHCYSKKMAEDRVQICQASLLSKIGVFTEAQLDLEDGIHFFDDEDTKAIASAAKRIRLAVEDLRAAEWHLAAVTTRRQQRLVADRARPAEPEVAPCVQLVEP